MTTLSIKQLSFTTAAQEARRFAFYSDVGTAGRRAARDVLGALIRLTVDEQAPAFSAARLWNDGALSCRLADFLESIARSADAGRLPDGAFRARVDRFIDVNGNRASEIVITKGGRFVAFSAI